MTFIVLDVREKIQPLNPKNAPSQVKEQKCDWGHGFTCAGRSKTNDKVAMTFTG